MVLGYLAIGFGFAGGIIEDGCDGFSTTVFPEILPFALTGVENELTTSSAASIPPMTTEHNAVFYGIETNDYKTLTPRFFGSFIEGYTPNELGLYGADVSDDAGIAYFNDKVNLYKSRYNFWKNKSSKWYNWIIPLQGLTITLNNNAMEKVWKKGLDWFPTLHPTWQDIIGAAYTEIRQTGCLCETYAYGNLEYSQLLPYFEGDDCSDYESGTSSSSGWTQCDPYFALVTLYKPNDGFILAESAANQISRDNHKNICIK